jgi:uncharacterized protein
MKLFQFLKSKVAAPPPLSLQTAKALADGKRYAEAVAQYKLLAEQGDPLAQDALARCCELGNGTLANPALAVKWYTRAAEAGHVPAIARLGEIYLSGLARPDTTTDGVAAQLSGPKGGSSLFQQMFPEGVSVEPDAAAAAHWNLAGALAGDAGCQARLGYQYASGNGLACQLLLARKWFRRGANGGSALGALGMGLLTLNRYGMVPRHYDPKPWLELATQLGDPSATLALGLYLLDHPDVAPPERAGQLLLKAAKDGQAFAMLKVGECYAAGSHGLPTDESNAEVWLRRAAAKGVTEAAVRLLRLLAAQPERNDQELAVLAREAADAGNGEAQYLMGVFCLNGQGTLQDSVEAAKWFELAAAQGVTAAHERLGVLYATGVGKPEDPQLAAEAFERAVQQGDLDALTHRAIMRQTGTGMEQDTVTAAAELAVAVAGGNAEAALQLGIAYSAGVGVTQDWKQAADHYRLAHERGAPEGAFNLGHLYEQGLGVEADTKRAVEWFEVAAAQGLVLAMWALYQRSEPPADGGLSVRQRYWLMLAAGEGDPEAQALLEPPPPPVAI